MSKINFLIKSKENPATIHVRFQNGKHFDLCKSTQLLANPNCWDKKNGRVKNTIDEPNSMFINSKLKDLDATITRKYMEDYTSGIYIDSDWLTMVISNFYNQKSANKDSEIYFTDFAKKWLDGGVGCRINISKGALVTEGTLKEYGQAIESVIKFDKYNKARTKFVNMDLDWHAKWVNYMTKIVKYSPVTARNRLSIIKIIIREAKVEYNIRVNPHFESKKFTVACSSYDEPKKVYLDDEKIKVLFELEVPQIYKNVKDSLIIGCWTGLRISDFSKNLDLKNMEKGIIDVRNKKTGIWVKFTLHPMIKIIVNENGGKLPKSVSEATYNKHVKEICKLAGFNEIVKGVVKKGVGKNPLTGKTVSRNVYGDYAFHELVTSHTGRRSLSSNLSGNVSDKGIMDIAGWSTKKMKEHYNNKEKIESAIEVDDYYNSEYGYLLEDPKK